MPGWHWCVDAAESGRVRRRATSYSPLDIVIDGELLPDAAPCAERSVGVRCYSGVAARSSLADDLSLALADPARDTAWDRIAEALHGLDRHLDHSDRRVTVQHGQEHTLRVWASALPPELERRVVTLIETNQICCSDSPGRAAIGLSGVVLTPDRGTFQILVGDAMDAVASRARVRAEVFLYARLWTQYDKPGAARLRSVEAQLRSTEGPPRGDVLIAVLEHARRLFVAGGGDLGLLRVQLDLAEQVGLESFGEASFG